MSQKNEMIGCNNCQEMTMHISTPPNHILHLILSIITGGAWFIVWMILLITQKNPQCTKCGLTSNQTPTSKIVAIVLLVLWVLYFIFIVVFIVGLLTAVAVELDPEYSNVLLNFKQFV